MRKLSTQEYIERCNHIHNYEYDYSVLSYLGSKKNVEIICCNHGSFFKKASRHQFGERCPTCILDSVKEKNKEDYIHYFLNKCNFLHGNKYDYSKVKCTNGMDDVVIICSKHGEFKQKANYHLRGQQCKECTQELRRSNTHVFTQKATIIHDGKYDYSFSNYTTAIIPIDIICKKHGKFKQTPNNHLRGNGCPKCKSSKGERKVRHTLKKYNVNFLEQYFFKDCKGIRRSLVFDFVILNNLDKIIAAIEFQGRQHYEPIKEWGGEENFKAMQRNDDIKKKYCIFNNITLVEIPYYEINNIDHVLCEFISSISNIK